ncbi:hypothetical protein CTEN210_06580 [Chaetoceros tenuissimus]|uniref:Leucine-rich repeat domain-containing protein n=1 Tax=Chaetoceros tenuissimus TaxID=426638 RepID=A0AAD3H4Y4_9STRA|nr:hypothetical protein CTEN210_06580 [Chaetoceros tenuissimus]
MRVQTEEWRRFIPGIRMYKGKKTFFYNGEKLWDDNGVWLIHDEEERQSWEVIIVLPGVEVIPEFTFSGRKKLETVIMADSVRRIKNGAFIHCESLKFVKLSRNLEYIGNYAFSGCKCLPSIFIPPSCQEIGKRAFRYCRKLIIFLVPQETQLGEGVIEDTALIKASPFEIDASGEYETRFNENVNEWIKNINRTVDDEFALHRACSSFNPITDVLYEIIKREGLISCNKKNQIGITPMQYLEANPFAKHIDQSLVMKRYILEMMGEAV